MIYAFNFVRSIHISLCTALDGQALKEFQKQFLEYMVKYDIINVNQFAYLKCCIQT